MNRLFILSIFFLLVLCVGCVKIEEVECNPPYIRNSGMCCMDQDQDGVCDADKRPGPLPAKSGDGITPVGLH